MFLTEKEIELLDTAKTPLLGILLDTTDNIQYPLEISVNDAKTSEGPCNPFYGNIVIEGFETRTDYRMFLSTSYFEKLKEMGDIGGRYGYGKVDIIEMSRAENDDEFKGRLRFLNEYFQHRMLPGNF